jgi:hypothetical protein
MLDVRGDSVDYSNLKVYSKESQGQWTRGMRHDFVFNETRILHNPNWLCMPSIVMVAGKGPRLLCCRHHNIQSMGNYLHVPRNPTGVVNIEASNQFLPAVPVVRMLRLTKAYQYCNSYAMSRLVGRYNDLDSTYVSGQGRYDLTPTDLSCRQDALSIIGRMEVREHIEQLTEEGKIPKWFAKAKLEDMESRYRSSFEELKKTYSSGATYVALEDALEIERIQKEGDLLSLEFRDAENHLVRENCVHNWPVPLPLVHPVGDFYGMKAVGSPRFNCTGVDSRLS